MTPEQSMYPNEPWKPAESSAWSGDASSEHDDEPADVTTLVRQIDSLALHALRYNWRRERLIIAIRLGVASIITVSAVMAVVLRGVRSVELMETMAAIFCFFSLYALAEARLRSYRRELLTYSILRREAAGRTA
jgi:hypothetical protein